MVATISPLFGAVLVLGLVFQVVSAEIVINNGCAETIHIDQVPGKGSLPSYELSAGDTLVEPVHGEGISVKISRQDSAGVLQLEYSLTDHFYWDLSDLDGGGAGVVVSPFRNENVVLRPTGKGANEGENKCYPLECPAGQTCQEAYQYPEQSATRVCPADTGDLVLDLCLDGPAGGEARTAAAGEGGEDVAGPAEAGGRTGEERGERESEYDGRWRGHYRLGDRRMV